MKFSFTSYADDTSILSIWSPKTTGDYPQDCAQGRDYADEVVAAMRQGYSQALLGWVVRGFGEDDAKRGVEVGFSQRIAEHVLS